MLTAATWWPAQDLEPRTIERYGTPIRNEISPAFGHRAICSLISPEEIAAWELGLKPRCNPTTAASARTLLSTILSDAKEAGLVDLNAAARRRGRGRKSTRRNGRRRRTSSKAWATPTAALLVAERCALLTGQDDDFVLWVTGAWCGLRWGEGIGLELAAFRLSKLFIDQQISEEATGFRVKDPKDDSFRNDEPNFFGALDLPPFLPDLLSRQIKARPPGPCLCPDARCGGGGKFLFLGRMGGHPRRGNYNRRFWRPACDGVYPREKGQRPRPARPVLVDLADGWPGVPLTPAWPYAMGEEWVPPRGHGLTRHEQDGVGVLRCSCKSCGAEAGAPCVSRIGLPTTSHRARAAAVAQEHRAPSLASWLPVKEGLTPHGLRHSHKVWMDEEGLPDILKHDRMGHVMPGIGGIYSHVSPLMRERLTARLQRRWETALDGRLEHSPTSPVPLLNELLTERRKKLAGSGTKVISRTSPNHGRSPVSIS